jgi:predicted MFS family arabinose efflux permease
VWPSIFFPAKFDPAAALAISVSTVGIAYFARPVGAFFFGHFGDKYGRRNTLAWTLIVMGISCVGTALLPPYASIGMLSVVLLFVLRFLVGFGLGGEAGGAFSWIAEAKPNSKHRGFWISWPQATLAIGKLLAILAFYIASASLSNAAYMDWGWRVPFAVGALMLAVGFILRVKTMESPMFQQLSAKRKVLKYPAFQLIREQWRKIFKLTWIEVMAACIGGAIFLPYSVGYLVAKGVDASFANLSVTGGGAIAFFTILGGAYLSDYIGRLRVLRVVGLFMIAFMFPYFFLLNTINPLWIMVAQMLLYGVVELSSGSAKAVYTESFATKYRYSGSGIGAQFAQLVGAGLALAVIFPMFIVTYGVLGAWLPVALFGIAMCVMNVIATFFVKETRGTALE